MKAPKGLNIENKPGYFFTDMTKSTILILIC